MRSTSPRSNRQSRRSGGGLNSRRCVISTGSTVTREYSLRKQTYMLRGKRSLRRILQDGQISSISTARSAAAGGRAAQMCNHPWRFVRSAVLIALPIKLILVFSLPITADEAYYFIWGHFLSGGYYDHPPLIGWLLYLFQLLGAHPLSVRLPAVLLTPIVGCAIYAFLKREDAERRRWPVALLSCLRSAFGAY